MRRTIFGLALVLIIATVGAASADSPVQYQLEWFSVSGSAKAGLVNASVTANIRNSGLPDGTVFHAWMEIDDGNIKVDSRKWEEYLGKGSMLFPLDRGQGRVISWAPQVRLSLANNPCAGTFRVRLSVEADGGMFTTGWMDRYCNGLAFAGWEPFKENENGETPAR